MIWKLQKINEFIDSIAHAIKATALKAAKKKQIYRFNSTCYQRNKEWRNEFMQEEKVRVLPEFINQLHHGSSDKIHQSTRSWKLYLLTHYFTTPANTSQIGVKGYFVSRYVILWYLIAVSTEKYSYRLWDKITLFDNGNNVANYK